MNPLTNGEIAELIDLLESARHNLNTVLFLYRQPHFREFLDEWPTQIEDAYEKIQQVVDRFCVKESQ